MLWIKRRDWALIALLVWVAGLALAAPRSGMNLSSTILATGSLVEANTFGIQNTSTGNVRLALRDFADTTVDDLDHGGMFVNCDSAGEPEECDLTIFNVQGGFQRNIVTFDANGAYTIGVAGVESPTSLILNSGVGGVVAKKAIIALASGPLTLNTVHLATAAADYDIPDGACNAAGDVGNWVTVIVEADDELIAITPDDASNVFNVPNLDITAGNELDNIVSAGHEGTHITLVCMAADQWYATSMSYNDSDGAGNTDMAWIDGGTAD